MREADRAERATQERSATNHRVRDEVRASPREFSHERGAAASCCRDVAKRTDAHS